MYGFKAAPFQPSLGLLMGAGHVPLCAGSYDTAQTIEDLGLFGVLLLSSTSNMGLCSPILHCLYHWDRIFLLHPIVYQKFITELEESIHFSI